jgi:hypothetical protein
MAYSPEKVLPLARMIGAPTAHLPKVGHFWRYLQAGAGWKVARLLLFQ